MSATKPAVRAASILNRQSCIRWCARGMALLALLFSALASAQVTIFPECNFQGVPVSLDSGKYIQRELERRGVGRGEIGSLIVPEGYKVQLYANDGFRGRSVELDTLMPCLSQRESEAIASMVVSEVTADTGTTSIGTGSTTQARRISAEKVELFADCDYKGRRVALAPGEYMSADLRGLGLPNNALSSLKVPEGLEVVLYVNDFLRGQAAKASTDQPCLADPYNNEISSLIVREATATADTTPQLAGSTEIEVFTQCDFRGLPVRLGAGEYSATQLAEQGIKDNTIASIRVPVGSKVTLYEHDFQRGNSLVVEQSVECLDRTRFHRAVSSLVVDSEAVETANTEAFASKVEIFATCDFVGNRVALLPGEYRARDLRSLGMPDNAMSSIRIPEGYSVQVFENDNFTGGTATLTESETCLSRIGADNLISSLIVKQEAGINTPRSETTSLSRAELALVDAGLSCVNDYVVRDLCNASSWPVLKSFCELEKIESFIDLDFLSYHVEQGNCTTRYWDQIEAKLREGL